MGAGVVPIRKCRNSRRRSPTAVRRWGHRRYSVPASRSALRSQRTGEAAGLSYFGHE